MILDNVKRHYNDMIKNAEFELEGFSEDELTQNRIITLSELGIALGMFVQDNLKASYPSRGEHSRRNRLWPARNRDERR